MNNWKLKTGDFLFKHRTFTPLPLILLVFVIFKPVNLGENNLLINIAGLLTSILGELIRIAAVGYSFPGTSGREMYLRADNLNTTGIYSIIRNPLYIGNFFMFVGLMVVFANVYALLVVAVFLIAQYYFIILSEEHFLRNKYGTEYENYFDRIRRIVPTFGHYRKNLNPFSGKKVLFKEKDSVFNMLLMFLLVLLYKERVFRGRIEEPLYYIITGVVLIIAYIIVKIIKNKATRNH